ncbi:MAG: hypothetical protein R2828_07615 [Saprospiraceae bacterium]
MDNAGDIIKVPLDEKEKLQRKESIELAKQLCNTAAKEISNAQTRILGMKKEFLNSPS